MDRLGLGWTFCSRADNLSLRTYGKRGVDKLPMSVHCATVKQELKGRAGDGSLGGLLALFDRVGKTREVTCVQRKGRAVVVIP